MGASREQIEEILMAEVEAIRRDISPLTAGMIARLDAAKERAAFLLAAQIGVFEAYGEHLRRLAPPLTRELAGVVRESVYRSLSASAPRVAEEIVAESTRMVRAAELRAMIDAATDPAEKARLEQELAAAEGATSPHAQPALRVVEDA